MARKKPKITDDLITRIEGQTTRERDRAKEQEAAARPDDPDNKSHVRTADPLAWVADQAGVARATASSWERRGLEALRREADELKSRAGDLLYARFAEALDTLRRTMSDKIALRIYDIADQTGDKNAAVNAAKLILPKVDPSYWGPQATKLDVTVQDDKRSSISRLPQEVIDALTDAELDEVEEIEGRIAEANARVASLVEAARARVG